MSQPIRNKVVLENGLYLVNAKRVTVTISEDSIAVGCTEISIEAARTLLNAHGMTFPKRSAPVTLQTEEPTETFRYK